MSWSRLIGAVGALATLTAGLGGCGGYQPLYGSGAGVPGAAERLARVEIPIIPDRKGQMLRNNLIDRFYHSGYPAQTDFALKVDVTTDTSRLALRSDASTERYNVNTSASFQLIDKKTGKTVLSSSSRAEIGVNSLSEQYGYIAAIDNALNRALVLIADDITLQVATELGRGS